MDQNQIGLLITLVASGVVLLGVLFIVLYIFVFSKSRVRKQIREITRRYSYLDALLIGQDSQYIHRIEIISRTNLLYVEKHAYFQKKFKDIYENDDKYVDALIKQLNLLVANNQYKNIKATFADTRKALEQFEKQLNALDKELYSLIKLEEESRQSILKYKEDFRRIKQIYFNSASSLSIISSSMNQVFDKLDGMFNTYDNYIDGAEYDGAKALIPTISMALTSIEQVLVNIPDLCVLVDTVIPKKIDEVTFQYEQAVNDGLPLQYLLFRSKVGSWNNKLDELRHSLSELHIKSVKEELDKIQNEILEVHDAINLEINDKADFENRLSGIYKDSVELENQFIKVCSLIPKIKEVYIITEDRLEKIEELRTNVSRLTAARNTLDNYIHSALHQPFSALNEKLNEVEHEYLTAKNSIEDFKAYFDSLKTYAEEAYNLIYVYYYRTKQIEVLLKNINMDNVVSQFNGPINDCYNYLNDVDAALKQKPIDVSDLNTKVEQLKVYANSLYDQIEGLYRNCQLAESALVYANRDRLSQKGVDNELVKLEELFFQGSFEETYQKANTLFKESHIDDNGIR